MTRAALPVAIAALALVGCRGDGGSDVRPVLSTTPPATTPRGAADGARSPGITDAEVAAMERELDEIDGLLADLDADLSED